MPIGLIEQLLTRTELPQDGARLDPGNPLARLFHTAFLPAVTGDNLGFGGPGQMPSHALSRVATPSGPATLHSGTGGNITAGRTFGPTPTYPILMVVVVRQTSNANTTFLELSSASGLIGGSTWRIGGGSSVDVTYSVRANFTPAGAAIASVTVPTPPSGGVAPALNNDLVIVAQSLSASNHRISANGSSVGSTSTSVGTLQAWDRIAIGTASGDAQVLAALMGHGGVPLSDAQMQQLSSHPSRVWELFEPQRIWVPVTAAGGGTSLTPGAGTVTLTGYAPTVAQPQDVSPGAGAVTISGFAPSVLQAANIAPSAGAVTLTGFAPSIAQPQAVAPAVGSLTLTGFAPSVSQSAAGAVTPDAGTLTLTGFAPTIAQPLAVAPGAGAVTLTGYAPTVLQAYSVAPDAGTLTISGLAPTVTQTTANSVTPDTGTLGLVGYAPTVEQSGQQRGGGYPHGTTAAKPRKRETRVIKDDRDERQSEFERLLARVRGQAETKAKAKVEKAAPAELASVEPDAIQPPRMPTVTGVEAAQLRQWMPDLIAAFDAQFREVYAQQARAMAQQAAQMRLRNDDEEVLLLMSLL